MSEKEPTKSEKKNTATIFDAVFLPLVVDTKSGGLNRLHDPANGG